MVKGLTVKHGQIKLKIGTRTNFGMENPNIKVLTLNSLIMHEGTDIVISGLK